jgi:hypothetical protein
LTSLPLCFVIPLLRCTAPRLVLLDHSPEAQAALAAGEQEFEGDHGVYLLKAGSLVNISLLASDDAQTQQLEV